MSAMNFVNITEEEVRRTISSSKDCGHALDQGWINAIKSSPVYVHCRLAHSISQIINRAEEFSPFLTAGVTCFVPKKNTVHNQAYTRPIIYLPALYRSETSVIIGRLSAYLKLDNILSEKQDGCQVGSRSCKEQLIFDSVAVGRSTIGQRGIFGCYIDYPKAFHSLVNDDDDVLHLYQIDPKIITFFGNSRGKVAYYLVNAFILG